jgi:hypothetical protein
MEIGVGLDVVKLAGFDQRTKNGPSMATAIAAGEEMILATECNRPNCAFNRVGIEFDAAIMQEARQSVPRVRSGSLRQSCCGLVQEEAAVRTRAASSRRRAWSDCGEP